jgi:hypothetical protein
MTEVKKTSMPGFNVMLMGPAGSGKTHAIGTLVEAGLEVYYLALEPGLESLLGYWTDKGQLIPKNLHWHTLKAPDTSFMDMMDTATKINQFSLEMLAKMVDPNKSRHNQYLELFKVLHDFTDQRDDSKHGSVNSWGTDKVLVIDSLTGLNNAALNLVIGGKPVRSQSDWGIAQQQLEGLLRKLCDGCQCHFVLLSHVERESDLVLGGVKLMASTLGKALAPKIPAMFSDVILTVRQGDKWTWDTANVMADLKTRNLPIKSDNPPSFAPIVIKWKARAAAS